MANKYRTYKKDLDYSYTLGIFLTIELLLHQPERVQCVFISSKTLNSEGVNKVIELCQKQNISYETNDKIISILSPKENCYVVGIFTKYTQNLEKSKSHVVLVNPSDSGNLGTIIRTSLGFGVSEIAIIKPGVDIFDPKTVRASMGALFNIHFTYFDTFFDYLENYQNHEIFTFMLNAKFKLSEINYQFTNPFSLVFGNEAKGLGKAFESIGTSIIIPHQKTIDSLNLSIAAGIALYEFTKQIVS